MEQSDAGRAARGRGGWLGLRGVGVALGFCALAAALLALGVSGSVGHGLVQDAVLTIGAWLATAGFLTLAIRGGMRRAARRCEFRLDGPSLVGKLPGQPERRIALSEIHSVRDDPGWLVVTAGDPPRRMAVPKNIAGYDGILAAVTAGREVVRGPRIPWRGAALLLPSLTAWPLVAFSSTPVVVAAGSVVALGTLAIGTRPLLKLARRGPERARAAVWVFLGVGWLGALLVIGISVARV